MSLINCKVELKFKRRRYCIFNAADNDKTNASPNNIIFTLIGTTLYVPAATLSAKAIKKLLKLNSKWFQMYWNEYKSRGEYKNTAN